MATWFDLEPTSVCNLALTLPFPDGRSPEHLASHARCLAPLPRPVQRGANVEIREAVGPEDFFLFGLDAGEVQAL